MPEILVEVLKRDDKKLSQIRATLEMLHSITGLPWIVSQHHQDGPYYYALDDAHVPLAQRLDWGSYHAFADAVNYALNKDPALVARQQGRRGTFPLGEVGLRFASVGGTLYNDRRIGISLLLTAAVEDAAAAEHLKSIDFSALTAPLKAMLKAAAPESELLKNLAERTEQKLY